MSQLTCRTCKSTKDRTQFCKDRTRKIGHESQCKLCKSKRARGYNLANEGTIKPKRRAHYLANKDKLKQKSHEYYLDNKDMIKQKRHKYHLVNKNTINQKKREYKKANRDRYRALFAKRRAKKLQAMPPWMTAKDFAEIRSWYKAAIECQWLSNEPLHVDHILPLQGKDVSGLHVSWNLQILPASENLRKNNKC